LPNSTAQLIHPGKKDAMTNGMRASAARTISRIMVYALKYALAQSPAINAAAIISIRESAIGVTRKSHVANVTRKSHVANVTRKNHATNVTRKNHATNVIRSIPAIAILLTAK